MKTNTQRAKNCFETVAVLALGKETLRIFFNLSKVDFAQYVVQNFFAVPLMLSIATILQEKYFLNMIIYF